MKKIIPLDATLIPAEAEKVFDGVIFDIYQWQQKLFDDSSVTYEMAKRPDTVAVIGVTGDKITVIEDEQPHVGKRLGFPGGKVDPGDSPLDAAKRECQEEIGYEFEDWKLVHVFQPHRKLEWFIHIFIATGGKLVAKPEPEAGEKITLELLSFDEIKKLSLSRTGYVGESQDIFEQVNSLEELIGLPKFEGQEVDR